jgi:hypothetical protein
MFVRGCQLAEGGRWCGSCTVEQRVHQVESHLVYEALLPTPQLEKAVMTLFDVVLALPASRSPGKDDLVIAAGAQPPAMKIPFMYSFPGNYVASVPISTFMCL